MHTYATTVQDPDGGDVWGESPTIRAASAEEAIARLQRWALRQPLRHCDSYSVGDVLTLRVCDERGRSAHGTATIEELDGQDVIEAIVEGSSAQLPQAGSYVRGSDGYIYRVVSRESARTQQGLRPWCANARLVQSDLEEGDFAGTSLCDGLAIIPDDEGE